MLSFFPKHIDDIFETVNSNYPYLQFLPKFCNTHPIKKHSFVLLQRIRRHKEQDLQVFSLLTPAQYLFLSEGR